MDPKNSRGYRNKNPGNIDYNERNQWQGQIGREPAGRFALFESHEYGIRALVALLTTYQTRYGLRTIESIINRWAPPNENNSRAYVAHVSELTGFDPKQRLDMRFYEHAMPLVKAIIHHELGGQPYDQATIDKGLELYGVVKGVQRPVATMSDAVNTGTGRAAVTTATVTSVAAAAAPIVTALGAVPQWVGVVMVLAVAAVAVVFILQGRKT